MALEFTVIVLFALFMVAMASFGHGSLALNDADNMEAMKPVCGLDRYGNKQVACPSPDPEDVSIWPCVSMADLCNLRRDCPNGEDETDGHCFYHRFRMQQLAALRKELESFKKPAAASASAAPSL